MMVVSASRIAAVACSQSAKTLGLATVLVLAAFAVHRALGADGSAPAQPSETVFLIEIVLLLVCGRLLGEAMLRIGQPQVMGQLIAGILLGPSVLGTAWPDLQHALFPSDPAQRGMIDAVSQLGILMLLLLTGMETDLSLVRRLARPALSASIAGIILPFLLGVAVGELLPDAMLPDPGQRLVTALFLGVALAISSVKIVAVVIREMNFSRRTLGQVIMSAAIVDDTIGWIVLSVIIGLALHGGLDVASLTRGVLGTAVFLVASFSIGRRLVFRLIRWANDSFVSEVPVITAILAVMAIMALITDAIGVHTVLGAFVAGVLVGQSPILTRHIDDALRGLITALFMPVFFGVAGLGTDLRVLAHPSFALVSLGLIGIASVGKFSGAFLGSTLGGLGWREALAIGCGMNARGSTEVIVATIGLSIGALSRDLFTMIVAMAIVTTMAMPPMLRWALGRLPLQPEEGARLEREAFEARGFVPNLERLLVAADDSANGRLISRLAGLLAGARGLTTTVLRVEPASAPSDRQAAPDDRVEIEAKATAAAAETARGGADAEPAPSPAEITTRVPRHAIMEHAIAEEARKGYDLVMLGVDAITSADGGVHDALAHLVEEFEMPFAIVEARGAHRTDAVGGNLDILVPVTGTNFSRRGAEVAIALARAAHGSVTALHVAAPGQRTAWSLRLGPDWRSDVAEAAILREIVAIGEKMGVAVRTAVRRDADAAHGILRQLEAGRHDLAVLGVSPRPGPPLSFGKAPAALLARATCSVLLVSS